MTTIRSLKDLIQPTFKTKVPMPVAGQGLVPVEFEFRHRSVDELATYVKEASGKNDVDMVMQTVVGWELEDQFSNKNVKQLLSNYHGAARAIVETYIQELTGTRK